MDFLSEIFSSGISIAIAIVAVILIFKIAKTLFKVLLGLVAIGAAIYLVINVLGMFTTAFLGAAPFGLIAFIPLLI